MNNYLKMEMVKMVSHTVKSLRDKLNELIINGYENYPVAITYDNEHGITYADKHKEPKIKTSRAYGNKIIFKEEV